MSTRANILLTENVDEYNAAHPGESPVTPAAIWLYHHSDGYLDYLGAGLVEFLTWYYSREGYIREYISDLATALVKAEWKDGEAQRHTYDGRLGNDDSFEVTTSQHGDIEYLYTITTYWNAKGYGLTRIALEAEHLSSGIKGCIFAVDRDDESFKWVADPDCESWRDLDARIDAYYNRE
jgi:hypothetical protein